MLQKHQMNHIKIQSMIEIYGIHFIVDTSLDSIMSKPPKMWNMCMLRFRREWIYKTPYSISFIQSNYTYRKCLLHNEFIAFRMTLTPVLIYWKQMVFFMLQVGVSSYHFGLQKWIFFLIGTLACSFIDTRPVWNSLSKQSTLTSRAAVKSSSVFFYRVNFFYVTCGHKWNGDPWPAVLPRTTLSSSASVSGTWNNRWWTAAYLIKDSFPFRHADVDSRDGWEDK